MRAAALVCVLLAAACGGEAPAVELADDVAGEVAEPAPVSFRYALTLEPAIADDGMAAVEFLGRLTKGAYAPDVTIGECTGAERLCVRAVDVVPDCGQDPGTPSPWGCLEPETHTVYVVAKFHPELRVSIVVHELLHTLGLGHADGSVMTPDRPLVDFYYVCVSAETAAILKARTGMTDVEPGCLRSDEP